MRFSLLLLLAAAAAAAGGAPPLLPGGILNLTTFTLQTPFPSAKGAGPLEVPYPALATYNSSVFYAAPCAGAPATPCVTFWAPETGATTPHSNYPRSELRQNVQWRAPAQGAPRQTHVQLATLAVLSAGAKDSVCIGQIHTDGAAACSIIVELEWTAGQVVAHLRDAGCRGSSVVVGRAALGQAFSYNLSMVGDAVQVVTDSGSMPPYQYSWFAGKAEPQMYFKAGAYLQSSGTDSSIGGRVQFSSLATSHYTL